MWSDNISNSNHNWQKVSLVTEMGGDKYTCLNCGANGRRKTLGNTISNIANKWPKNCNISEEFIRLEKTIQIRDFRGSSSVFKNLTEGSIHECIEALAPYKCDNKGVWVMGVGEPAKVLNSEFITIDKYSI